MKNLLIATALVVGLGAAPALAACPTPITGKDASGTTQNFSDTLDASGNCASNMVILDATAGTNKLSITSNSAAKVEGVGVAGTPAGGVVSVQGVASGTVLPVSAASLPLPTGASTSALQTTGNTSLSSINTALTSDPCFGNVKINVPISTASGTTVLVTGVSAKKIYVCSLALIAPSAVSVSLSEGSSNTCGTSSQAGVIGVGTNGTAVNGLPLAANGGLTYGNGGGTVASTATAANYLCLFQSGTAQIAGNMTYVQQ
jgi:hypothetical protein